jgi:hypothetical protein
VPQSAANSAHREFRVITRIDSARRRVALVGSGVLLLCTAAVITTAAADSGGNAHPVQNQHRYADYLDDQNSSDPCAQPLNQRSSGWVCPTGGNAR